MGRFFSIFYMAIIKPFKGVRPPKEYVERVESRPYDVLDSDEARAEAGDNEMSLYHIIKPEINFPEGTSEYDPRVYKWAALSRSLVSRARVTGRASCFRPGARRARIGTRDPAASRPPKAGFHQFMA